MSTKFFEAKVHNTISLEELSEIIQTQKDDLDVETIKSMSHLLQGLCLNPQWFLEYLHQQLKNNFDSDETHGNLFSSNSFVLDRKLLHKKSGPYSFLVRANVWLAAADSLRRNTRKIYSPRIYGMTIHFIFLPQDCLDRGTEPRSASTTSTPAPD